MTLRPILVVAMANSVHTARWLAALRGGDRPVVIVPVSAEPPIRELAPYREVADAAALAALAPGEVGLWPILAHMRQPPDTLPAPIGMVDRMPLLRHTSVVAAVCALRPVLVHAMEVQQAGYACLLAAQAMAGDFPPWLVSNWGSDLLLYRKLAAHRPLVEAVLRRADAYLGECARDLMVARELGYAGPAAPPIPASGGMRMDSMPPLASLPVPSQRREILVKGYHGWAGRALHILSAIHLAAPALVRFRIRVVLANEAVAAMVDGLRQRDGLDIAVEPYLPDHAAALARVAEARLTVGLGISDGIGTTLLEAMSLGSFPIVACTSCAHEWLRHGQDGLVQDPHDVAALAVALERAAGDDALVDAAALRNRAEVERRWDLATNARHIAALYAALLARAVAGAGVVEQAGQGRDGAR